MDKTKIILIGVCVLLTIVVGVVLYRSGVINERTAVLKANISLHKDKADKLLKQAEKYNKQNTRLLKEIDIIQCEIEIVENRLIARTKQYNKLRKDVQDNIDSYINDSSRISIFSDLIN